MSSLYHTFFFDPLYNALLLLFKVMPWADAGVVIVILTVIVRLILFPLSRKAVVTQVKMAEIGPELERIKEKHKNNSEEQARLTLALYKEKGVNPFSGIFVVLIQIPLIIALYQTFIHFSDVRTDLLYSFVSVPAHINTVFLGLIDLSKKSVIIAALAAISSFIQLRVTSASQPSPKGDSFGDNLTRNMQAQMKYLFPFIVFFIAYRISGVVALYWLTTNLFTVAQEVYVRRNLRPITSV